MPTLVLKTNKTLTSLDLYHGLVGAKGAESIAAGLRENTTLKVINLGGNYIGPEGTKSVLNSLDETQTTNSKYFKIRGPTEPMKFFRKKVPAWKKKKQVNSEFAAGTEELSSSPSTVALPDAAISSHSGVVADVVSDQIGVGELLPPAESTAALGGETSSPSA